MMLRSPLQQRNSKNHNPDTSKGEIQLLISPTCVIYKTSSLLGHSLRGLERAIKIICRRHFSHSQSTLRVSHTKCSRKIRSNMSGTKRQLLELYMIGSRRVNRHLVQMVE